MLKIWYPNKLSDRIAIERSSPISQINETIYEGSDAGQKNNATKTELLYADSRHFVAYTAVDDLTHYTSDTDTTDDAFDNDQDDEHCLPCSTWATVDLVREGVFPKTFETMKTQPRCVLCSVAFVEGETVTVSAQSVCHHEYHERCLKEYWRKQATKQLRVNSPCRCPVCRTAYI